MNMKEIYESKKEVFNQDVEKTISEITDYIAGFPVEKFVADIILETTFYNTGCRFGELQIKTLQSYQSDYCRKVMARALLDMFQDDTQVRFDSPRFAVEIRRLNF